MTKVIDKPLITLVEKPLRVATSEDCGAYFCEHAFFVGAASARRRHVRLGFLHVPSDDETFDVAEENRINLARQSNNRVVIGSFLRGLLDDTPDHEIRVLLTGFGPFKTVVDNPSGTFVEDLENLTLLIEEVSTGASLLGVDGSFPLTECARARLAFQLRDGRRLVLCVALLPVDERVLNRASGTAIDELLEWSDAQTALLVGVASYERDVWRVETLVTDGGLAVTDGGLIHEKGRAPSLWFREGAFVGDFIVEGLKAFTT